MAAPSNKGKGKGIAFLRDHVTYAGDDCLIWPMNRDDKGYGTLGWNGKVKKAARVMCELVNGPPPTPKHESAHSCGRGNQGCVHPGHLSWKTRSDNQLDRRKHGTHGKGDCVGRNKLTVEEVAQIRADAATMTHRAMAARHNCHPSTISKIVNGARWRSTPSWLKSGLSRADLETIKASPENNSELASRYGVGYGVIARIRSGHPMGHIK